MYRIDMELSKIIRLLLGHFPHHIRNTHDFVYLVKAIRLEEEESIKFYDVRTLFTLVTVDPPISLIRYRLEQDIQLHCRTPI